MTPYEAAILCRQRLNLSPNAIPRLLTYIDPALEALAGKVSADPRRRSLLTTDLRQVKSTVTVQQGQSQAPLRTVIDEFGVMEDRLDHGIVWHKYPTRIFADTDVTGATDTIAIAAHGMPTGLRIRFGSAAGSITGVDDNTDYYIISVDAGTISIAASPADAFAGTELPIAPDGSGTIYLYPYAEPVQWGMNSSFAPLERADPLTYVYGEVVDDRILLKNALIGDLLFSVPYVPTLTKVYANDTFDDTDVTAAIFTIGMTGHLFRSGLKVRLTGTSGVVTGVVDGTDYYVIKIDDNTIGLATTEANAYKDVRIAVAPDGSGTVTVIPQLADTPLPPRLEDDFISEMVAIAATQ